MAYLDKFSAMEMFDDERRTPRGQKFSLAQKRKQVRVAGGEEATGLDYLMEDSQEQRIRYEHPIGKQLREMGAPHSEIFEDTFRGRILRQEAVYLIDSLADIVRAEKSGQTPAPKLVQNVGEGSLFPESEMSPMVAAANDANKQHLINRPGYEFEHKMMKQVQTEQYRMFIATFDAFNPKANPETREAWTVAAMKKKKHNYQHLFPGLSLLEIYNIANNSENITDAGKAAMVNIENTGRDPSIVATEVVGAIKEDSMKEIKSLIQKYPKYSNIVMAITGGRDAAFGGRKHGYLEDIQRTQAKYLSTEGIPISTLASVSQGGSYDFTAELEAWRNVTFPDRAEFLKGNRMLPSWFAQEAYEDRFFGDILGFNENQNVLGADGALSAYQSADNAADKVLYGTLYLSSQFFSNALFGLAAILENAIATPLTHGIFRRFSGGGSPSEQTNMITNVQLGIDLAQIASKSWTQVAVNRFNKIYRGLLENDPEAIKQIGRYRMSDVGAIMSRELQRIYPNKPKLEADRLSLAWARVSKDVNPLKFLNRHPHYRAGFRAMRALYQDMPGHERATTSPTFRQAMHQIEGWLAKLDNIDMQAYEDVVIAEQKALNLASQKTMRESNKLAEATEDAITARNRVDRLEAEAVSREREILREGDEMEAALKERAKHFETLFNSTKRVEFDDPHSVPERATILIVEREKEEILKKAITHPTIQDVRTGRIGFGEKTMVALARLYRIPVLDVSEQKLLDAPEVIPTFYQKLADHIIAKQGKTKYKSPEARVDWWNMLNLSKTKVSAGTDMDKVHAMGGVYFDNFGALDKAVRDDVLIEATLRNVRQTDEFGRIDPARAGLKEAIRTETKKVSTARENIQSLENDIGALRDEAGNIDLAKLDKVVAKLAKGVDELIGNLGEARTTFDEAVQARAGAQQAQREADEAVQQIERLFIGGGGRYPPEMESIILDRLAMVLTDFKNPKSGVTPEIMADLLSNIAAFDVMKGVLHFSDTHRIAETKSRIPALLAAITSASLLYPRDRGARALATLVLDPGTSLEPAIDSLGNSFLSGGEALRTLTIFDRTHETGSGGVARIAQKAWHAAQLGLIHVSNGAIRLQFLRRVMARKDLPPDAKDAFKVSWHLHNQMSATLQANHLAMAYAQENAISDGKPDISKVIKRYDYLLKEWRLSKIQDAEAWLAIKAQEYGKGD